MIHAISIMMIPSGKRDEALEILRSIAQQTRFQAGCVSCNIFQDVEEKNVLMIDQYWSSESDLERHLRSHEYRNVLLVIEMSDTPPEIRFDTISRSAGVELIEKARNMPERGIGWNNDEGERGKNER